MSDSEREREEEEKSGGFKVTDRRLFTPEGERRPDTEEPPKKAEERRPPAAGAAPEQAPTEEPHFAGMPTEPHGPVSFEHLVMSLATTAMFQLGLVKSPEEEQPRADLIAAKETIDLLDILQQKTKGNLSEAEDRLLTGSLYELRMVFVELSSKAGRSR